MALQQWLDNAWLNKVDPSAQEIANLLQVAEREISDGSVKGMSPDGTFVHAYSAVRTLCSVALHASGHRVPKGTREHERVIESVKFTLGETWTTDADYFDRCRRLRHKSLYDGAGVVQRDDADALLDSARKLQEAVTLWLRANHANLL